MELIYLWIHQHNCIENQGIPLSQNYTFQRLHNVLHINPIKNLNPPIHQPFTSITALIGKNGTGKSSIIEALVNTLFSQGTSNSFIIMKISDQYHIIGDTGEIEITGIKIPDINLDTENSRRPNVIYYSPIYSPQNPSFFIDDNRFLNVANSEVYRNSKALNRKADLRLQGQYLSANSHRNFNRDHLNFDKYLEIDLQKFSVMGSSIKTPRTFDLIQAEDGRIFTALSGFPKSELTSLVYKLSKTRNKDAFNNLKDSAVRLVRHQLDYLSKRLKSNKTNLAAAFKATGLEKLATSSTGGSLPLVALIALVDENIIFKGAKLRNHDVYSAQIDEILIHAEKAADNITKLLKQNKISPEFPIQIPPEKIEDGIYISRTIEKDFNRYSFNSSWKGMSTGQIAKLNLYSRIYNALLNTDDHDDLILILDEADIYLHPEWQRTFLQDLISFLNQSPNLAKRISLIISSHSPILISDLYLEMVNILTRDQNNNTRIEHPAESPLATNIHTMYKNDFLLSSTLGAIVSKKIEGIIQNKSTKVDSSTLNFISNIGDPVLKRGLLNHVSKNLSSDEMLAYHESEVKRLREKRD